MRYIKLRRERYSEVIDIEHVEETLNHYRLLEKKRQRRLRRQQYERERYMKKLGLKE